MATWKKIISSGSKAHLLNITSSGGMQIGSLSSGGTSDNVLIRDSSGEIKFASQVDVGSQGSSVNVFATMSIGGTNVTASSNNDTLDFIAGNNIQITGSDGTNTITLNAVTKSVSDITTILSQSLIAGPNITINETSPSSGVFSITGSSALSVMDTYGQIGVDLTYNSTNASLTASLVGLTTESSVKFADITTTGNISASGYISASALHVKNDATIGGNLALDGNFLFDGYNFESSSILNHSGSNIFGADGPPSDLFHQFTGSISITGSGVTLVDGVFYGDGSGLTNLSAGSLPGGLLSSSEQIASDISGAYTADQVTINKADGVFSAITTGGVGLNNANLATGDQIYSYIDSADTALKLFVLNNYITSITTPTDSGMAGGATEGTANLAVDIGNLPNATSLTTSDFIAILDSGNSTKKATIAELGAIITASSAGTVTSVTAGDGLTAASSNPFTDAGTISVVGGANITSDGTGVYLNQTIGGGSEIITSITATTGSFGHLRVTGDTTVIESETLQIADNFMWLNSNESGTPGEDAGIAINRGALEDANLFWDEGIDRWSLSKENIADQAIEANADAYITSVSTSIEGPDLNAGPSYGSTANGQGNMHVDTTDGEIWIYV